MLFLKEGNTALILAAAKGHQSMVEVLVNAGASLDIQNEVDVVYSIESEYVSCLLVYEDALLISTI